MNQSHETHDGPDFDQFSLRLTPAVQRAAEIARELEGRVTNSPKASERTAVKQALTEADIMAQEEILGALLEHYPNVSLAAEEDTPGVKNFPTDAPALVIIDPIDGTLDSYLNGEGPYSVIVGLAYERRMRSGLVALPREGLVFRGREGGGAQVIAKNGSACPVEASADGDRVIVSHSVGDDVRAALQAEGLEVIPGSGGAVSVAPLLPGVRAGLRVASRESGNGVSIRGRVGLTIAREAGAIVRGDRAETFPMDLDTPHWTLCVTAEEEDQQRLERLLRGLW
ncbi:MAG: hypothetical protein NZ990_11565 [Myxococcota bacterium]|nr:hypothetical protein [Myxococcota bacterium]